MTTDNKGAMTAKSVAVVRVTHKGYGMELSTYVAYALPEGMHHLYAQPAQAVTHALTPKMIEAAYEAHYGKERVRTCGGAAGIDMTVDGVGYNGVEAFTRMWNGALGVIAPVPAEGAKTCCRKRPCEHPGKGPCDMPAAPEPIHASDAPTDDAFVMDFAEVMKAKMARSREKGRGGWQDCSPDDLSRMLREHVEKGDPVDVANFCMMLYHLGKQIAARPAAAVDAVPAATHTTVAGESVAGIALRQLGDVKFWRHLLACNPEWSDLSPHDYFPIGTVLVIPQNHLPDAAKGEA